MPSTTRLFYLLIALTLFFQASGVAAHEIDEAVWENQILEDGRILASLKLPTGLINRFDSDGNGHIDENELTDEMIPIIDALIWVDGDGKRGKLNLKASDRTDAQTSHTSVGAVWSFPSKPKTHIFNFNYYVESKENPKCIARFTLADKTSSAFVFTKESTQYEVSPASRGFYGFLIIGVEHILLGFDHLLFVAVLMLAGGNGVQLFKMVTAFTLAHSVTLALAVLGIFTLPGAIVEPIIALSIVVAAVENMRKDEPDDRWMLAGGFGLIHGMGFAGVLGDMGLSGGEALVPLLGFNVGVEAGQIGVIFLALPMYYFISQQEWNRKFRVGGSVIAGLIAVYWTIERILGWG